MSKYLHELCCLLVEEFYGVFHASIYSHLTPAGRFNVSQLAHKLHLPIRQVKAGLATLIQLRLVHHHTSEGLTTYQSDAKSTYNLLRCGKLVELAQRYHGELGGIVITQAYLLGFTTVSELKHQVELKLASKKKPLTNGSLATSVDHQPDQAAIHDVIDSMLQSQFFIRVRSAQFQSDYDAQRDAEIILRNSNIVPPTKGRKGMDEYVARRDQEISDRQSSRIPEYGYVSKSRLANGVGESEHRPAKRRRLSTTPTDVDRNGNTFDNSKLVSDKIIVGLSFHNIVKNVRNDCVTSISGKLLGRKSSHVMANALSQVPVTEQWVQIKTDHFLNIQQMQRSLNQGKNDSNDEGEYAQHRPVTNGHVQGSAENHVDHYSWADVSHHLAILADGSFPFIQSVDNERMWSIDKQELDGFLQEREILRLVGDRLQPPALRILRMLISKGKLDEKTLQEAGLLGAKQLRQTLAELKQMGFVDLQEVPREAQRQPNRTIFLWFHDAQRVKQLLLENLYKSMLRLLQRLKVEKKKIVSTLEKVERSDVQGSEAEILSVEELKVLRRLQRTEGWLLGELGRLDDSVVLLRDL